MWLLHVFVHITMSLKQRKKERKFYINIVACWNTCKMAIQVCSLTNHNSMTYKINDLLWISNDKNQTVVKEYIHYSLKWKTQSKYCKCIKLWQWILHGGSFCGITDVEMMGKYFLYQEVRGGQGIVVGIVTGYVLDRPIKSQSGQGFLCLSRLAPRSISLPYNGYWVFPRGKLAGVWCWLPTLSMCWSYNSASPLWLHRHVMEWPLPLLVSEPWPPTLCLITSLTELCHRWQIPSQ